VTILRRFVRDRRRSLFGWAAGISAYILLNNAFFPSFKEEEGLTDLTENLPDSVKALFGFSEVVPIDTPAGYLQAQVFSQLPIFLLIFAISVGTRALVASEEDGTLELLLANPVSRARAAVERLAGFVILTFALGFATTGVTLATAPAFELVEGVSIPGYAAASFGALTLALLFGALAFGVGAATGRRSLALTVAGGTAVATYTLNGLAGSVDAAAPLRFFTPWHWYLGRNMLAQGIAVEALVLPVLLATVFAAIGRFAFQHRDLR
jgi:ABC-2 type transport system permease protein